MSNQEIIRRKQIKETNDLMEDFCLEFPEYSYLFRI